MSRNIHVCIDLGNQNFKMAVFAKKGKKLSFLKGLIEKVDFALTDSFHEFVPTTIDIIKKMLSKLEIHPKSALFYFSLPGQLAFSRLLKLPLVDRTKIHQMVQYEAQQQVPFSLDEVIWNYQILGNPDPEHLHVLLAAIRLEFIQELLLKFIENNFHVELMDASPIVTFQCISQKGASANETAAVVNLGARSTNLMIYAPNTVWIRTITMGGDHFTEEIQKELKLETAQAEQAKIQKGAVLLENAQKSSDPLENRITSAMEIPAKRLVAEITRSIGFYNAQFKNSTLSKIFLTGGSSQIKGLDAYLSNKLSIPVEFLDPTQNPSIEISEADRAQFHPCLSSEVMGLGLRLLKGVESGINLLPKNYLSQNALARKKETLLISAAVAFLIIFSQALFQRGFAELQQSRLNGILSTQKELESFSNEIKTYTNQAAVYSVQTEEMEKLIQERDLWINIFQEFQKKTPSNIWFEKIITSYTPSQDKQASSRSKSSPPGTIMLTINCKTTGTYKDVSDYKDILDESPLFKSVQISSANPPMDGMRDFVIQANLEESL